MGSRPSERVMCALPMVILRQAVPVQANLLTEDAAPAGCEAAEAVSEARFVEGDLESVVGLIGLQTITSEQEYDGSRKLFLFEQLTHLDRCGSHA